MAEQKSGIGRATSGPGQSANEKCILHIRNRSGSRLNLVLHGTEVNIVRAMTVRRFKRLKLIKGTYVVEAWLSEGRIGINAIGGKLRQRFID